jgi:hypothetical protein
MPSVLVQFSIRLSRPAVLTSSRSVMVNTGISHDLHQAPRSVCRRFSLCSCHCVAPQLMSLHVMAQRTRGGGIRRLAGMEACSTRWEDPAVTCGLFKLLLSHPVKDHAA